jgi:hypothetical protein
MRPSISSRGMPGTWRNYRKPIQQPHNEDRGLAEMLLDSFHIPRVLPPQLAALVVLLKMQAAEHRRGTRENDPLLPLNFSLDAAPRVGVTPGSSNTLGPEEWPAGLAAARRPTRHALRSRPVPTTGELKRQRSRTVGHAREPRGVFEPEDIAIISAAYYAALADLGLSDQEDAVTLLVARRVIELASEGERDPARLRAAILASLSLAIALAMGRLGTGATSAFEAGPIAAGHEGRRPILTRTRRRMTFSARVHADLLTDLQAKRMMLEIAESYEGLARACHGASIE